MQNPIKSLREHQQKQAAQKRQREIVVAKHQLAMRPVKVAILNERSERPYTFKPQGSGIQRLLPPVHP